MPDSRSKLPEVTFAYVSEQYERIDLRYFADMSPTQAKAMIDTAKYTHAVPARQETYRYYGGLALVLFLVWQLLPLFRSAKPSAVTIGWVIIGTLAIVGGKPLIEAISKAVRGS